MSNKRRKRVGSEKIKRARLIRVIRGARRLGAPAPGFGVNTPASERDRLRSESESVAAYFGGRL